MQNMSTSGDKYKENLKQAAESLLKGGTLLSEPCENCNGIQVKKNNEVTCIICGNSTTQKETKSKEDIDKTVDKRILQEYNITKKLGERRVELIISTDEDK